MKTNEKGKNFIVQAEEARKAWLAAGHKAMDEYEIIDFEEIAKEGGDPYAVICERVFGKVTAEGRRLVKNYVFMLRYGGKVQSLKDLQGE